MAYFSPLKYEPFQFQRAATPEYNSYMSGYRVGSNHPLAHQGSEGYIQNIFPWQQEQAQKESTAFQGYAGDQFQSLFDAVNDLSSSPAMTGQMFSGAPKYAPYEGTRADFTTHTPAQGLRDDYTIPAYDTFDQRGYLDAQFGNMNDYLSKLGSYFGNMGQSSATQQILANAPAQGPTPIMPSIGGNLNIGGGGSTSANNPFPSYGVKSGGWGTAPTSLFGAGANANNP